MGDTEAHFVGFRNDVFLWKGFLVIDETFSGGGVIPAKAGISY